MAARFLPGMTVFLLSRRPGALYCLEERVGVSDFPPDERLSE